MHLGKMGLMLLVPALALSGCTTSMTAEQAMARYGTLDPDAISAIQHQKIQRGLAQIRANDVQIQQTLQTGFQTIQRGQAGWQDLPEYTYQRPDNVFVHCRRLSDSVVSCRKI